MSINEKTMTPCFCISLKKIAENYNTLSYEVKKRNRNDIIAYSIKANYNYNIIMQLDELGSYFEVCSKYEYNMLVNYGINPSKIIVNGCHAMSDVSTWAKRSLIIIDSYEQLLEWTAENCQCEIGIRVNLDHFTKDDRFKSKKSRFGMDLQSDSIRKAFKTTDLSKIICLHCHLAGNSRDPSIYCNIVKELFSIINEYHFKNIKYIDIGGGFKVGNGYWRFCDYLEAIDRTCQEIENDVPIIYELGNSLVRNAVEYRTKIVFKKYINGNNILIADGTSLHLPKASFKKLGYHIKRKNKTNAICAPFKIVGNTCKESDVIIELENEIELSIGDILILENVGAYSINEINTMILGMPQIYVDPPL